ncbi:MAG: OmpA family protein [Hyphomicrobiales bacterium]|nr:OmpA family protein [Hyphomicrobiales bacterium]
MAARIPRRPPPEEEGEDWLVTYADAITLLMAFFVMLVNFSRIDIPLFEEAAAGIKSEIGRTKVESPIKVLKLDLQETVRQHAAEDKVSVGTDNRGILIELDTASFYEPGSADIRSEVFPLLSRLAQSLNGPDYRGFVIEVEGHTDDVPIATFRYPSNWELSAARAAGVVRYFIDESILPDRLRAVGLADTRPKAPNLGPDGAPIAANRAANRRIVVRVFPASADLSRARQRHVGLEELTGGRVSAQPPRSGLIEITPAR